MRCALRAVGSERQREREKKQKELMDGAVPGTAPSTVHRHADPVFRRCPDLVGRGAERQRGR